MTANRYADRVAVVTGGSRRIGLAIAGRIVAEGGRVCITGRKQDALDQAVSELGGADVAMAIPGSADDADHQRAAVEAVRQRFGAINVLVNSTGINPAYGTVLDDGTQSMRKILEVNGLGGLGGSGNASTQGWRKAGRW